jgi:hypothetical protein
MDHIYTQYKGLKVYNGYSYWYLTYDNNPDIPLGDNGSMNNTSDINDCISIDSDYEGVASLSNSSVYNKKLVLDIVYCDRERIKDYPFITTGNI